MIYFVVKDRSLGLVFFVVLLIKKAARRVILRTAPRMTPTGFEPVLPP